MPNYISWDWLSVRLSWDFQTDAAPQHTLLLTTIMWGKTIPTDLKYTVIALGSLYLVMEIKYLIGVSYC